MTSRTTGITGRRRAIMVMFDSLNRHMLPPYGDARTHAPNFTRLATRTVTYDNNYAGSMPCMPSRRELHTGRPNFLHRSWGPLEPFDDSMPQILRDSGVHTHLTSDHPHYWEDGGATYHTRYSTWEFFRGQEADPWKADLTVNDVPRQAHRLEPNAVHQDWVNRRHMPTEAEHSQTLTFDAGIDFIETNAEAESPWFLQIECFDPHEPFFSHDHYKALYPHSYDGPTLDWPGYQRVTEDIDTVEHVRSEYLALLSMCDRSLGRVLDTMDEHKMWDDTMLIVCTDHGFLLGEHGWWAKSVQPWFNELVHTPLFVWDPRHSARNTRSDALVQMIDLAPTLLEYFGQQLPGDMIGQPLDVWEQRQPQQDDKLPGRSAALFGVFGGHVNVTDGRFVYMRACATPENRPLSEYTLMPTRMRARFRPDEFKGVQLTPPFAFTKNVPVLRVQGQEQLNPYYYGTLLFDLSVDPRQEHPIVDDRVEMRMAQLLVDLLRTNDAPDEQFVRLGLPASGDVEAHHLLCRAQRSNADAAALPIPRREEIPHGKHSLLDPLVALLSDPRCRRVLERHLPQLTATEFISTLVPTPAYDVAVMFRVDPTEFRTLAQELADIAPAELT